MEDVEAEDPPNLVVEDASDGEDPDFLAAMDAERDELRMRQLEMIDEPSELPMPVPQQPQQQESQISCLQNYVFPEKKTQQLLVGHM